MILLNLVIYLVFLIRCTDSKPNFYLIETKESYKTKAGQKTVENSEEKSRDTSVEKAVAYSTSRDNYENNSAESETSTEEIRLDCKCGKEHLNVDRIIGGKDAEMNEFPWMAEFMYKGQNATGHDWYSHICGAVLISSKWLLTAAHCYHNLDNLVDYPREKLRVRIGNHNQFKTNDTGIEIIREIDKNILHPDYIKTDKDNDIALVKLKTEVDLMLYTPVCLPDLSQEFEGIAYVIGWGYTKPSSSVSDILQKVKMKIRPSGKCQRQYTKAKITEGMFCAGRSNGKKDSCRGDSGGPLTKRMIEYQGRHFLAGITSWGMPPCATPGYYGVYTKVSHYMDWIYKTIYDETYPESVKFCNTE